MPKHRIDHFTLWLLHLPYPIAFISCLCYDEVKRSITFVSLLADLNDFVKKTRLCDLKDVGCLRDNRRKLIKTESR